MSTRGITPRLADGLRSLAESQLQMQTVRSALKIPLFNGALTFLVLAIVIELVGKLQ
jgi:hypothetical protein